MEKMNYSKQADEQIIQHENHMLKMYMQKVQEYIPLFAEKGCTLDIGLMWTEFPEDTVRYQRGTFQNGYRCHVYCVVRKSGEEISIESNDGEADYYSLSTAWMVSAVFRRFFKLKVSLCTELDDVDEELKCFLGQVKGIGAS